MNSFGRIFRVSIFGESHGKSVGVVIDGVRPGISISKEDFEADLSRRRGGSVRGSTTRSESDIPEFFSGVCDGKTTGAPLAVIFSNNNTMSKDYSEFKSHPRPGHSDFAAMKKYNGFNDIRGGGHFSARLTAGLVAAGVIAKKMLDGVTFNAELISAGGRKDIAEAVEEALKASDSIGGLIECRINGVKCGTGEPFFGSVESEIARILFSIPAVKGVEFGAGMKSAEMKGSEFNDKFIDSTGKTSSNNSGGINGGIANGNEIIFRAAFRPTPSIFSAQNTFNFASGKMEELVIKGRHDSCVALRAPVIVEAAAAIALCDLYLSAQR
ncbi:MAG TPA: chorismate synthase [Spirochaetota bacterium]|nr:chorismate synthase [Spirochaetota bacterium]HQE58616.1 chorismate synthase [Spirochaetota bacterium]